MQVWTVGHSNRTAAQFVAVLSAHGIETVCDVRRYPRSNRHPHFDRAELEAALREAGIAYRWLGETLGGYRDYDAHMKTPAFEQGVRELIDTARASPCAFMCAERDHAECHRRFIADHLLRQERIGAPHPRQRPRDAAHRPRTALLTAIDPATAASRPE